MFRPEGAAPGDLVPSRALGHPTWWAALALLALNDHALKGWGPAVVTGKLSDVCGLVVAPALIATVFRVRRRSGLLGAHVVAGLALAAINVSPRLARAAETVAHAVGVPWRIWVDPTDLVALLVLPLAFTALEPTMRRGTVTRPRMNLERLGLAIGAAACLASSAPPPDALVVTPGKVVAQGWTGEPVFVVDTASGERLRAFAAPGIERDGARLVADDVLYTARGATVVGHRLSDGAEVLDFTADDASFHDAFATDQTRLFLLSEPAGDHAMERVVAVGHDGQAAWSAALPSERTSRSPSEGPVVTAGLVVVTADDQLVALDPAGGSRRWTYRAGRPLRGVVGAGRVVCAFDDEGGLHAIDTATGRPRWRAGGANVDGARWGDAKPLGATDAGTLVFIRGDQRLVAIDATSQAVVWRSTLRVARVAFGPQHAVVDLGDGDDGHRYGLVDLRSGAAAWVRELDVAPDHPPHLLADDGIVLFAPSYEQLVAFELGSGERRWTFDLDEGSPMFVAGGAGGSPIVVARR
ncbi:MAG: PQQ-binding-like beta-propeller repeat protein [Myxococcota bacterium]